MMTDWPPTAVMVEDVDDKDEFDNEGEAKPAVAAQIPPPLPCSSPSSGSHGSKAGITILQEWGG